MVLDGIAAENDLIKVVADIRVISYRGDRHFGRLPLRIRIYTGTDRRKCKAAQLIRCRELQRLSVAGCEQFRFPIEAASPNRAYGMNDSLGRQPIGAGDFGLSGLAPVEQA